jgi:hypothetical protein
VTPIYSTRINHPMAWRGGDFSKDDIAFDLSRRHVAALEDVLLRVRGAGLALGQIRAEDCRHPALDRDLERVLDRSRRAEASLSYAACRSTHTRSKKWLQCFGR